MPPTRNYSPKKRRKGKETPPKKPKSTRPSITKSDSSESESSMDTPEGFIRKPIKSKKMKVDTGSDDSNSGDEKLKRKPSHFSDVKIRRPGLKRPGDSETESTSDDYGSSKSKIKKRTYKASKTESEESDEEHKKQSRATIKRESCCSDDDPSIRIGRKLRNHTIWDESCEWEGNVFQDFYQNYTGTREQPLAYSIKVYDKKPKFKAVMFVVKRQRKIKHKYYGFQVVFGDDCSHGEQCSFDVPECLKSTLVGVVVANKQKSANDREEFMKVAGKPINKQIVDMILHMRSRTYDKYMENNEESIYRGLRNSKIVPKVLRFHSTFGGAPQTLQEFIGKLSGKQATIFVTDDTEYMAPKGEQAIFLASKHIKGFLADLQQFKGFPTQFVEADSSKQMRAWLFDVVKEKDYITGVETDYQLGDSWRLKQSPDSKKGYTLLLNPTGERMVCLMQTKERDPKIARDWTLFLLEQAAHVAGIKTTKQSLDIATRAERFVQHILQKFSSKEEDDAWGRQLAETINQSLIMPQGDTLEFSDKVLKSSTPVSPATLSYRLGQKAQVEAAGASRKDQTLLSPPHLATGSTKTHQRTENLDRVEKAFMTHINACPKRDGYISGVELINAIVSCTNFVQGLNYTKENAVRVCKQLIKSAESAQPASVAVRGGEAGAEERADEISDSQSDEDKAIATRMDPTPCTDVEVWEAFQMNHILPSTVMWQGPKVRALTGWLRANGSKIRKKAGKLDAQTELRRVLQSLDPARFKNITDPVDEVKVVEK